MIQKLPKGAEIRRLLEDGESNRHIKRLLGVSSATVSYHARKLGLQKGSRSKYDWHAINTSIAAGASLRSVIAKYGMAKRTIEKAIRRGDITYSAQKLSEMSAAEYAGLILGRAKPHHRKMMRKRLLREGTEYKCAECGIKDWMGKSISLEVDHKDGDARNNGPENLRLLCPNCHSQTPTWRGRNAGRYDS